jgi:uncharacterized membrane protein
MIRRTARAGEGPTDISRFEMRLSRVLRWGLAVSTVLILTGIVVSMVRHPEFMTEASSLEPLLRPGVAVDVTESLMDAPGRGLVTAGLLVLMATPVLRVLASIITFGRQRDWLFLAITSMVLVLMLLSFGLGRVH